MKSQGDCCGDGAAVEGIYSNQQVANRSISYFQNTIHGIGLNVFCCCGSINVQGTIKLVIVALSTFPSSSVVLYH
jgi:hypothetical protein